MTYDVAIIGAGFAGSIAAQQLSKAGTSVIVLEARDRIGGRTLFKKFGSLDHELEFGGTYIATEYQSHIMEVIDRYALELKDSLETDTFAWHLNGEVRNSSFPVPIEEWMDMERAITYINTHAARIRFGESPLDQPGLEDLDIPLDEFLDRIDMPPFTREFIFAAASLYFGNYPSEVSALWALSWVAGYDNSSVGWYCGSGGKLKGGMRAAIEAIHADMDAEVRLNSPVVAVDQNDTEVVVTLRTGETIQARTAIVAIPVNTWSSIAFTPELVGAHAALATEKHAGVSTKAWAHVKNVPGTIFGLGHCTTFKWVSSEAVLDDGTQLMVGFGSGGDDLDVDDKDAVAKAFAEFVPGAEIIEVDAYNWNKDEYALGTWMAYRPGQVMHNASGVQQPHGRIVFSGSDIASGWAGWVDGALESGKHAAGQIETMLAST